jgi:hypothetical protein
LRRILFVESALTVGTGCLIGVGVGIYGQAVVDGYLRHVTGFPVASAFGSPYAVEVLLAVIAGALLLGVIPAWIASNVGPELALEDE